MGRRPNALCSKCDEPVGERLVMLCGAQTCEQKLCGGCVMSICEASKRQQEVSGFGMGATERRSTNVSSPAVHQRSALENRASDVDKRSPVVSQTLQTSLVSKATAASSKVERAVSAPTSVLEPEFIHVQTA